MAPSLTQSTAASGFDMAAAGLPAPVLVTDNAGLVAAAEDWKGAEAMALDTEFVRTDTFYPILGLIQLCTRGRIWLIDPLTVSDMRPLAAVLADPAVIKVLHSCSEDLEVFRRALGQLPTPLFDTQIAAAMTGFGFSISYRALVKKLLEVELEKEETRSDWLKRPLTDAQLRYAAEDVHYLMAAHRWLADTLDRRGRNSWFTEDMAAKLAAAGAETRPEDYYLRIKGAWRLDRRGLAILQRLATWREREACRDNRPRSWIITDTELLGIAARKPRGRVQLAAIADIHPRVVRRYGHWLVDAVNQVLQASEDGDPPPLPQPLSREYSALVKACQERVAAIAAGLGVAPEILARRIDIEHLVRTFRHGQAALTAFLATGWRKSQVGEPLLFFMNSQIPAL